MRFLYYMLLAIFFSVLIAFVVINTDLVSVNFYFTTVSVPISLALAVSCIFGCLVGFLVCLKTIICEKYHIRCLKKEIKTANKEISNLRSIPIKGDH